VRSGRVVVSAAVLVVIVVGSFAFTSVAATKVLGVGIALAVIFDTLLIACPLCRRPLCYLGRANWWSPRAHIHRMSARMRGKGFSGKAGSTADVWRLTRGLRHPGRRKKSVFPRACKA